MKLICTSLLIVMLFTGVTMAQECGPNCPVCSGAGSNDGTLQSLGSVMFSAMAIPTAEEETAVFNARVGISGRLDAGLGYAVDTEKILWSVRAQPFLEQEDGWKPGLILGTGSVQIGGSDQSLYAQLIKSWNITETVGLQFSGGAATLLPDLDQNYGLAGITANLRKRYAVFANYDGETFHEGISWIPSDWMAISVMLVESEFPAVSVSIRR